MIAFLTSLPHPQNACSYERRLGLLTATLGSVCRQTDPDFVVLVVCNEEPGLAELDRRVHFIPVDFPPPSEVRSARVSLDVLVRDKGTKYGYGLAVARDFGAHTVMVFDSDDFVSNRLAVFLNANPHPHGYYFPRGYMADLSRGLIRPMRKFHLCCGTSLALNMEMLPVPADVESMRTPDDVINRIGPAWIENVLGLHDPTEAFLRRRGLPLAPLPYRGAVWAVANQENQSGPRLDWGHPITRRLADEFGFEHHGLQAAQWGRAGLTLPNMLYKRIRRRLAVSS